MTLTDEVKKAAEKKTNFFGGHKESSPRQNDMEKAVYKNSTPNGLTLLW